MDPFRKMPLEPEVDTPSSRYMAPIQPVQKVGMEYVTAVAVQKPRDFKEIEKRLNQECQFLGPDAYYGWGVGEDRVEGPSVELAMAVLRCFGNCAVRNEFVQETHDAYVFEATFVDLENGVQISRPFRQSKSWKVYGKMDEVRKADVRFQIGASKCARNVIIASLPSWMINNGMEQAKESVRARIDKFIKEKSIAEAQRWMLKELAKLGAKEDVVLYKMGRDKVSAITPEDLVILYGDVKALQSGAESAAALFPSVPSSPQPEQGQAEALKAKLKAEKEAQQPQGGGEVIDDTHMRALHAIAREHSLDHGDIKAYASTVFGVESTKDLTTEQQKSIIDAIKEGKLSRVKK